MAGQYDLLANSPLEQRISHFHGLDKREELKTEVSDFHKMVHKFNEDRLHTRERDGSADLNSRNSLPAEMIELLDELAMVEKEINRLEIQINELKSEPIHEEQQDPGNVSKRTNDKASLEMKALHFITKAIKGDYKLSDFSLNHKPLDSKRFPTHHDQSGGALAPKRGGILIHSTPLRDQPRHLTPKQDRVVENPSSIAHKVVSTPVHNEEEMIHKWGPNKLSENIMRCLIFIFLRLLRTSRGVDQEKPIARSIDFSLSFRSDMSSNAKSSLTFLKDSQQQDPYGVFDSKESLRRDIGPYKNLVRFSSSSMDLKCIKNSASVPLFHKLKILMDGLERVDIRFLSHRQKLAFWINMYNACIMHGYLQYGRLIKQATLNIAGNSIDAQTIERFILRKPADSQEEILGSKEMLLRDLYGLKSPDPNIVFALCCGTRSSPAVKIYRAEGVRGELERSKMEYLQASIVVTSTKRIALPELLLRNMFDFGQDVGSLLEWVCDQLPASGSLRKAIVDCFRRLHGEKPSAVVEMIPYDFHFQYLFAV